MKARYIVGLMALPTLAVWMLWPYYLGIVGGHLLEATYWLVESLS